jgi:hypothetical protein
MRPPDDRKSAGPYRQGSCLCYFRRRPVMTSASPSRSWRRRERHRAVPARRSGRQRGPRMAATRVACRRGLWPGPGPIYRPTDPCARTDPSRLPGVRGRPRAGSGHPLGDRSRESDWAAPRRCAGSGSSVSAIQRSQGSASGKSPSAGCNRHPFGGAQPTPARRCCGGECRERSGRPGPRSGPARRASCGALRPRRQGRGLPERAQFRPPRRARGESPRTP